MISESIYPWSFSAEAVEGEVDFAYKTKCQTPSPLIPKHEHVIEEITRKRKWQKELEYNAPV